MMTLSQKPVEPLSSDLNLTGLAAVVTGASAGIGFETARQLLQHGASKVILAVRNIRKGETCKDTLLADPKIRNKNPNGHIEVLELNMSDFVSVKNFATVLRQRCPTVNLLVLNAGLATAKYTTGANGHELGMQVHFLANVLLINLLLPHLEQSTIDSGRISRITWLGSRASWNPGAHTFQSRPLLPEENIVTHFDADCQYGIFTNYADVKLLCYMYMRELARWMDPEKCTITMLCPGMVDTAGTDVLPFALRVLVNIVKAIRARPVEVGGWLVVNAAVVVGSEGHGKMFFDKYEAAGHEFVDSEAGREIQGRLWSDTAELMDAIH